MPRVNLFTSLYVDKMPERDRELRECIAINCRVKSIDRVVVLEESPYKLMSDGKLMVRRVDRRPTFGDMFAAVSDVSGDDDLNIVCNTDIFLTHKTVLQVRRYLKVGQCFALSRWDVQRAGYAQLVFRSHSQDCWMFIGKPKTVRANYFMGKMACDNRLAHEMREAGYDVLNPAKTIRTFHLHLSGARNYSEDKQDWIPGPYLLAPVAAVGSPAALWYGRQRERVLYRLRRMVDPESVSCRAPSVGQSS